MPMTNLLISQTEASAIIDVIKGKARQEGRFATTFLPAAEELNKINEALPKKALKTTG